MGNAPKWRTRCRQSWPSLFQNSCKSGGRRFIINHLWNQVLKTLKIEITRGSLQIKTIAIEKITKLLNEATNNIKKDA